MDRNAQERFSMRVRGRAEAGEQRRQLGMAVRLATRGERGSSPIIGRFMRAAEAKARASYLSRPLAGD
ncbi:hypothetical protein [Sorangium sp. So ce363]|uniref:hypothetical protein n=1 Tax=Sorangium sp. So ce363 TaxID=3133304 RepID=UPI003F5EE1FA